MPLFNNFIYYFAWIYPLAFKVSAQRTAPPAAPLTVLWESPTNFQSYTVSSRRRPTDTPMPCSKFTSSVTCGRLSSSRYWMNCFGALGSSNSCGSPLNSTSALMSCSLVGFLRNLTNTAAVCPFSTGTRTPDS